MHDIRFSVRLTKPRLASSHKILSLTIYHDFFSPPRRGSHVKSDNTQTIINNHPLAHILDICALIFSSCAFFTVYPTPLRVITTRARVGGRKEHRAKQKWPCETNSVTYVPGLSTLSDLSVIDAQPPSFLCCSRLPSHHPSSLTSVSLVPPSTYFCHQHLSGHTVLIHSFLMPKPSEYSLICSTR